MLKKRAYEQRIREIEHSSFTPLVLSATGGMANEANTFYKRLASCLTIKRDQSYSPAMSWLRCRLTFSLLRSAIQCIRGARSSCGHATRSPLSIKFPNSISLINHSLHAFIYMSSVLLHHKNYTRALINFCLFLCRCIAHVFLHAFMQRGSLRMCFTTPL